MRYIKLACRVYIGVGGREESSLQQGLWDFLFVYFWIAAARLYVYVLVSAYLPNVSIRQNGHDWLS
jgi:hypothetical protein